MRGTVILKIVSVFPDKLKAAYTQANYEPRTGKMQSSLCAGMAAVSCMATNTSAGERRDLDSNLLRVVCLWRQRDVRTCRRKLRERRTGSKCTSDFITHTQWLISQSQDYKRSKGQ